MINKESWFAMQREMAPYPVLLYKTEEVLDVEAVDDDLSAPRREGEGEVDEVTKHVEHGQDGYRQLLARAHRRHARVTEPARQQ